MTNYAVAYGCNKYASPDAPPLNGCVNDVLNVQRAAFARGFTPQRYTLLTDAEATTETVLEALDDAIARLVAGDILLFDCSSHGTQMPAPDAISNDTGYGQMDILCTFDFDFDDQATWLSGPRLVEVFKAMPAGAELWWLADACHSGDVQRELSLANRFQKIARPKFWANPAGPVVHDKRLSVHGAHGVRPTPLNVAFLSGCSSRQTSADTVIDGTPQGAMTGYFLAALAAMPPATSMSDVAAQACRKLKTDGYDQTPQCDGPLTVRPFLAGKQ